MKIYVGNLARSFTSDDLRKTFEDYGMVEAADVVVDSVTCKSKGYGFVEMPDYAEAKAAIRALDGSEKEGRVLKVSAFKPRKAEPQGLYI